jgi:hypothetical protein
MCRFSFSFSTIPFTFFASDCFVMSLHIISDDLSSANTFKTFHSVRVIFFYGILLVQKFCIHVGIGLLGWPFSQKTLCFFPIFMFKCFMCSSTDMVK